ncbi:hypothetical protein [Gulosibacter molinativorax]|uniref:Uncharacterized protein n=1 Tax=Gulosibacter molinativorax TaxID=256821 RepID=A0ABT7CAJ0_9MICO|nr:hypothetical protein [Gulosibacter molinativorax]MDJ1372217.1 hypothetical protein [Gulosibacter molinativorax]QUY60910.1 Hypotetical protein [Gulosibacter molinativorax]
MFYTTRTEAIESIIEALGEFADEHDIDAIADEVIEYDDAYDAEKNVYHLDRQGFYIKPDTEEFWAIVQKHAL